MGDYRKFLPGFAERRRKRQRIDQWGEDHELWRMDVRGLDLGLVGDKIERAVREAITKHLLVDMKGKRLVVVMPSLMPHSLLNKILGTLFATFQNPNITLLSPPTLATAVAGLRSGLVVDIGWRETVVTGMYEYREVHEQRTTRAMRMVTLEMARLLGRQDTEQGNDLRNTTVESAEEATNSLVAVDLEQAEEVTTRMAWCRSRLVPSPEPPIFQGLRGKLGSIPEEDKEASTSSSDTEENISISVPSPSSPRLSIQIPFSVLSSPVETALLADSLQRHQLDDHDQPLHKLIYQSLLSLPPDVRAICMSRIIITGGGSNITGLKARLLNEVAALVEARGWDPVEGKAADERRGRLRENREKRAIDEKKRELREVSGNRHSAKNLDNATATENPTPPEESTPTPASLAPQISDPIQDKLRRDQNKETKPPVSGVIRGVHSLGAWAGASLLVSLRVKGVVEIDRDAFLQHGMAGARRDAEASAAPQKGMARASMGSAGGWTLGPWA